jgi:cholesterol transport system auxiliary component
VRFDAQLRRGGSRNLLATRSFVVTQTPSGVDVPQIVAAFGAADDALAQQVVAWTLDIANRDRATHPRDDDSASRPRSR